MIAVLHGDAGTDSRHSLPGCDIYSISWLPILELFFYVRDEYPVCILMESTHCRNEEAVYNDGTIKEFAVIG